MKFGISAPRLIKRVGIASPDDIDLEAIAYAFGAVVRERPLENAEARIIGAGDRAIISVKQDSHPVRKRFSLAHELGHWFQDCGLPVLQCSSASMTDFSTGLVNREALANRFAAELLMPDFLFRDAAARLPITFDTVRMLAKQFRTSLTATAIRLVQLGSYPSMVCRYWADGRRHWYVATPRDVPFSISPHRELGRDTLASKLPISSSTMQSEEIDASSWIGGPTAKGFTLREDSIKDQRGDALSLLWFSDERLLSG